MAGFIFINKTRTVRDSILWKPPYVRRSHTGGHNVVAQYQNVKSKKLMMATDVYTIHGLVDKEP